MHSSIRPIFRHAVALIFLALWLPLANAKPGPHPPFEITGMVTHNPDGDTIDIQTADRGLVRVRFSGADTPETAQAFWKVARNHLSKVVKGQQTTAWCYKTDRYEREVCHVRVGSLDVCLDLIQRGYGWYARMFSHELTNEQQAAYAAAEEQAQARKIGVWSLPDPMPPWECRKLRKAGQKCR